MSRHERFDEFHNSRRYTDLYHDGLVALWRDRYEQSLRTGMPPPDLPREVEAALIRSGRRLRSEFIADVVSRCLRRLRTAIWPGR